jgi:hypothetical protein
MDMVKFAGRGIREEELVEKMLWVHTVDAGSHALFMYLHLIILVTASGPLHLKLIFSPVVYFFP